MGYKKPTLADIAKRLNISPASVSRALADNPRISLGLREQVRKTSAEMGYVPNTAARVLRTGKPDMAALMVPNLSVLRLDGNLDVLQAIDEELGQQGIRMLVASYHQPTLANQTMRKVLADPRLAGFLFLTNYITEQLLDVIKACPTASVIVNAYPERHWEDWTGLTCSGTENLLGALLATKHLIGNGHTKIGALVCETGLRDADLREEGFNDAMKEAGLDVKPSWVIRCDFLRGFETGRRAIDRLMAECGDDRPTALYCSSDDIAAGAMKGLSEVGLSVPGDMAIVGFGNHPLSQALSPSLTTVTHDGAAVGRNAARLFLDRIGKGDLKDTRMNQPAELIVRESSGGKRPDLAPPPVATPAPALVAAAPGKK